MNPFVASIFQFFRTIEVRIIEVRPYLSVQVIVFVPNGKSVPLYLLQDLPLGLMDDIYDFVSKFSQRLDEVEEV